MNDFYCHIQCEQLDAKCEKLEALNAELLEALEGLSKKAAQHFWRDTVVIQARAAIARAKGGSNE